MNTSENKKRIENIIKFHAHDYRDMKQSEDDLVDFLTMFLEAVNCDHDCTSNCRSEGCDCACGNYHFTP